MGSRSDKSEAIRPGIAPPQAQERNYVQWLVLAGAASLFLVTYPLFDPDLYWHLANGRAMIASGHIVNEEIFSYTHHGEFFVNHEWLSQAIFFIFWQYGGMVGLYVMKAVIVSCICVLVYHTVYSACRNAIVSSGLTTFAVLAGIERYHVRPELFSLLCVALLTYILSQYESTHRARRLIWATPAIFLVWDWLHGAVVGFLLLLVFGFAENAKHWRRRSVARDGINRLNAVIALTVLVSAISPYGLRSYEHFAILATSSHGAERIIELQPMWTRADGHIPFLLMILVAVSLVFANRRHASLAAVLLIFVFAACALRYNRLSGMAAIVIVAAMAQLIAGAPGTMRPRTWRSASRWTTAFVLVVCSIATVRWKIIGMQGTTSPNGAYVLPSQLALGVGINEKLTPAGSVRFILDKGLNGNMYNNANLAGYLCYYLTPERPIFQYNMPPIFGDTTRFVKRPSELEKWRVNYALAGSPGELTRLFPPEHWAWIYSDYVSTLVVRRTPEHKAIIDTYEIRYFAPEQPTWQYKQMSDDPEARPRLAFEMGVYLAYMSDARIAKRWQELLGTYPDLTRSAAMRDLLTRAAMRNEALSSVSPPPHHEDNPHLR